MQAALWWKKGGLYGGIELDFYEYYVVQASFSVESCESDLWDEHDLTLDEFQTTCWTWIQHFSTSISLGLPRVRADLPSSHFL